MNRNNRARRGSEDHGHDETWNAPGEEQEPDHFDIEHTCAGDHIIAGNRKRRIGGTLSYLIKRSHLTKPKPTVSN